MGLPEIFNTSQTDSFEQTLMMTTFELTSWLVAFVAVMTILVAVMGIVHLLRSESKAEPRPKRAVRRHLPASGRRVRTLDLKATATRQI